MTVLIPWKYTQIRDDLYFESNQCYEQNSINFRVDIVIVLRQVWLSFKSPPLAFE